MNRFFFCDLKILIWWTKIFIPGHAPPWQKRNPSLCETFGKAKILQNIDGKKGMMDEWHLMIQSGHMPLWPKCAPILSLQKFVGIVQLTQQARIHIDYVPLWRKHDQIRLDIYIFFSYFVFIFLLLRKCVFLNAKYLSLHDYGSLC